MGGDVRELLTSTVTEEKSIPRKFLFFTVGQDKSFQTRTTTKEVLKKFQMDWEKKDQMQEYFRYKAVQSLSNDALEKGDDAELQHAHHGISPITDAHSAWSCSQFAPVGLETVSSKHKISNLDCPVGGLFPSRSGDLQKDT